MAHVHTPEAEALLEKEFRVLDRGFVRLVDYMGSDSRIVASARVSYGKGAKTLREDEILIDYLLRHGHTSPFEQVVLTFHAKMPIFVARQWIRHRTARLNEISGRYSVMADEFYLPEDETVRLQCTINKQGRSQEHAPADVRARALETLSEGQRRAYGEYREMLDAGIARELARIHLPLSLYTEWYWQMDLHNLFHFLALRLHPHAQLEIRAYARVMLDIARAVAPMAVEAFQRHILDAVSLSAEEVEQVRRSLVAGEPVPQDLCKKLGLP